MNIQEPLIPCYSIYTGIWDLFIWDPRAPSIGGAILRKGHLVQVRSMKFVFSIGFSEYGPFLVSPPQKAI